MIRFDSSRVRRMLAMLLTAATSTVHAQPAADDAGSPPRREVRLSLAEAVSLSVHNDPDLAIAGLVPRKAAAALREQRGTFDPVLSLFGGMARDRVPPVSVVLGSFRETATAEASVRGRLPLGTEYDLRYGTTRLETDAQIVPGNPISSAYVDLQLRQPLLRGLGTEINRAGITLAEGDHRIAEKALRRRIELTVSSTIDAYWRLVQAHKRLAVARESLRLAQALVEQTEARVAAGDLPSIELTQARASVAARQEAVIVGQAEVGDANDALARRLVLQAGQEFDVTFVPTDEPRPEPDSLSSSPLLEKALRQRAELQAVRHAVLNAELAAKVAENGRRPDLSAVAGIGVGSLHRGWPHTQSQLVGDATDQYRWNVGVVFSVPLGNRAARAAHDQALIELERARRSLRILELQITEEVRVAGRALEASRERVRTTRRAAELARAQLEAGEMRRAAGLSTAFEVLRLQTDLATAQNAEIEAEVSHRVNSVRVQLATGALFDTWVRLEDG